MPLNPQEVRSVLGLRYMSDETTKGLIQLLKEHDIDSLNTMRAGIIDMQIKELEEQIVECDKNIKGWGQKRGSYVRAIGTLRSERHKVTS